ncbi:MAG: hypothetical protein LBI79_08190, partial [Nitrososphaerota archaeon]|nr:hypothetical protein [Nitrososphaerota archaeon]
MRDGKSTFDILSSIEKHIESLKPLLPKQTIVCIGEYPIKTILKEPAASSALPIFIEKSSDDIYRWLPRGYIPHFVRGFEDESIDTHFWYNVLPYIVRDTSVMESLKKNPTEKLRGAIIFSSVWDGVGSAAVPGLIRKFRSQNIDSLSIAVLPSKIQPADAHFNAYASLQLCLVTDGATVLLLGRDELEGFEGVDRKGTQIRGIGVVNYLLSLFLAKELLVQEISELSRTFNIKMFSAVAVTAASYRVYGSLENMLNTALLKPLLTFDLSKASLLYVLLRMPSSLKDQIPRVKIELAITNWFKERTSPQSIHITEPIYIDDMTDRIDAVLFVGGFDISGMFGELDTKVQALKNSAVERGYITEDWQVLLKVEEPKEPEMQAIPEDQIISESLPQTEPLQSIEEHQTINEITAPTEPTTTEPTTTEPTTTEPTTTEPTTTEPTTTEPTT